MEDDLDDDDKSNEFKIINVGRITKPKQA